MTTAMQMTPWKQAEPAREEKPNGRVLRARKCNPPRLTSKVANSQKAKEKRK